MGGRNQSQWNSELGPNYGPCKEIPLKDMTAQGTERKDCVPVSVVDEIQYRCDSVDLEFDLGLQTYLRELSVDKLPVRIHPARQNQWVPRQFSQKHCFA